MSRTKQASLNALIVFSALLIGVICFSLAAQSRVETESAIYSMLISRSVASVSHVKLPTVEASR